jgi:hypothetical protein
MSEEGEGFTIDMGSMPMDNITNVDMPSMTSDAEEIKGTVYVGMPCFNLQINEDTVIEFDLESIRKLKTVIDNALFEYEQVWGKK